MEQKLNYEMEILGLLRKEKTHIRDIARKIKTNHMNIKRSLDRMAGKNWIDYSISGKNKVFFIKNNMDSRNAILSLELYKQRKLFTKYPQLKHIFEDIMKNEKINLAILFGSYAKFSAHKESDIDIYIKNNSPKIKKEIDLISSKISLKVGEPDKNSLLWKEIKENHIIIKGLEEYYEKTEN